MPRRTIFRCPSPWKRRSWRAWRNPSWNSRSKRRPANPTSTDSTARIRMSLTPEEVEVLWLSLRVAFWSVVVSLPFAVAVAYVLARASFPGKILFDAVVHLPLVLPPVVVGFFLLLLFGRRGPLGEILEQWFGIVFAFRWTGAALAAGIMGFPLMVRAIRLSFET